MQIYNKSVVLNSYQNFISARYCENEWVEFNKLCNNMGILTPYNTSLDFVNISASNISVRLLFSYYDPGLGGICVNWIHFLFVSVSGTNG